ncbi:hypothetical protein M408DRAFT_68758 [Serendipita vermifera MAFF 305830]|uniref:5-demethoxyubiquinone hydroxylase, mitochondrial n=1 Tax=Serendipita vermifera MAFF 305830 TaxID=933852 RepID=A0A0C3AWV7_SERVB|nr:hypothetical protein M408DRAFT_68758 [Serendipita vermifera MAFF 305830]
MSLARVAHIRIVPKLCRTVATTSTQLPSSRYLQQADGKHRPDPATHETPQNLTKEQTEMLHAAIRVDQAGEVAANWIYKGQLAVLGRDPTCGPLIEEMWEQEKKHLAVMNRLQTQHDVRPTLLTDVAKVAGFGLGAVTALMGKEAAMACTEAVETVIGEHYDDQLRDLKPMEGMHASIPLLQDVIREFRDDELEHLDTAVEHHSQRAPHHALLTTIVEGGCQIAIQLCKRI